MIDDPAKTWAYISALPEEGLRMALAEYHEGWRPIVHADVRAASGCSHQAPDGALHYLKDYTGHWDAAMPLAWRYGIDLLAPDVSGEAWVRIPAGDTPAIRCTTEHEARVSVCRLALYCTLCEQEIVS